MTKTMEEIQVELGKALDPTKISTRQGRGDDFEYLSAGHVVGELNRIFGHLGWSRVLVRLDSRAEEGERVDRKTGEVSSGWHCCATAVVTLRLHPNGQLICEHTDVGHGVTEWLQRTRGDAIQFTEKSAVTDALKRAASALGNCMGLALRFTRRDRRERGLVAKPEDDQPQQRAAQAEQAKEVPIGEEPMVGTARWLLEGVLDPVVREELKGGGYPGRTSELIVDRLPADPGESELGLDGLDRGVLEELAATPPGQPLHRMLLNDVHSAVGAALGQGEAKRLWGELGVELKRGARVTGYQARLLVAAALAQLKTSKR